ncbi:MAG: hypothetical protein HYV60_16960, partial [Planctomycetia bacterium]|nr:hypothetical protein [Planctomycetia bacterium]
VQHHFAHVVAGMLEHGLLDREVLGVSWDGTGFGEDGTMWGGEFLVVNGSEWPTSRSPVPEARHSLCRWRKPPEREQIEDQKPGGLTQGDCADPSGLKLATSEDVSKETPSKSSLTLRVTETDDPDISKSSVADVGNCRRVAHLRPFAWQGGDIAVRQPWRIAVALLSESFSDDAWIEQAASLWSGQPVASLRQMHRQTANASSSTSVGRLFDAVAAIILGIDTVQYEGQAAMMLESIASSDSLAGYSLPLAAGQLDWRAMIRAIWDDRIANVPPARMSTRFHRALAGGIVAVAAQFPELPIVLAGGVFQNKFLTELVVEMIDDRERLMLPGRIPPNDGGLAAGQLAIAVMRERASQRSLQTREQ